MEAHVAEREAEAWFREHGLPYFVDDVRTEVRRRLHAGRIARVTDYWPDPYEPAPRACRFMQRLSVGSPS